MFYLSCEKVGFQRFTKNHSFYFLKNNIDIRDYIRLNDVNLHKNKFDIQRIISGEHEITEEFFSLSDELKIFSLSDFSLDADLYSDVKLIIDKQNLISKIKSLLNEISDNYAVLYEYLSKIQIKFLENQIKIYDELTSDNNQDDKLIEDLIVKKNTLKNLVSNVMYYQSKLDSVNARIQNIEKKSKEINSYVKNLKMNRLKVINEKLRNPHNIYMQKTIVKGDSLDLDNFVGEGILIFSFIQILISILFVINIGFIKENIIFSAAYLIFNFFSFLIFNKLRFKQKFENFTDSSKSTRYEFENLIEKLSNENLKKIMDVSFFEALQAEKDVINKSIKFLTGGKTLEDLRSDIRDIDSKIDELTNITDCWIEDKDHYYYCKRELNLLTIEIDDLNTEIQENNLNKFKNVGEFLSKLYVMKEEYIMPLFIIVKNDFDYQRDFGSLQDDFESRQIIFISFQE